MNEAEKLRATNAYGLLDAIERETSERSLQRTVLVTPSRGEGREVLRALARRAGSWVGLEVTTLRPLALSLVAGDLAAGGVTVLDDFAELGLVEELIDEALEGSDDPLGAVAESPGFREALRTAIAELRLADVHPGRVRRATFSHRAKGTLLADLLERFSERCQQDRLADTATLFRRAAVRLEHEELDARVLLVPGLPIDGLAGRFVEALLTRGARALAADVLPVPVPKGIAWPTATGEDDRGRPETHVASGPGGPVDVFRAGGVTEELREVLRRIVDRGLRWDEAEIVATDAVVYGSALHALCQDLTIPVTFAVGLPVERTRPGRVVAAWFRWVEDDFAEAAIRPLLTSGDLFVHRAYRDVSGPRLGARLRGLRIGWGRDRYLASIDAALERVRAEPPEAPDWLEDKRERAVRELEALRALFAPVLAATPELPARLDPDPPRVSPAELASGLRAFLAHVRPGGPTDDTAAERLERVLDRVGATLRRPTSAPAALAQLAEHLRIRIPAPRVEGKAPWGSAAGHLHLSDVRHGGFSGRPMTFVVGMDAGRFPGSGSQDSILLDSERAYLSDHLRRSTDRLAERRFDMAAMLARARGPVTFSWCAWEAADARALSPSPLLLDVHRKRSGSQAGFGELEATAGPPVSRIPADGTILDADDAWLDALARDGRLLDGTEVVRRAFPGLDRGLRASTARRGAPSSHHGLVGRAPDLDLGDGGTRISSSRLQTLGTCPLRYFYHYVLGARRPDDPEFDPERWLNALQRGRVLHRVFDRLLREARRQGLEPMDAAFARLAGDILEQEAARERDDVPVPSAAVFEREVRELRLDVASFVGMTAEDPPDWMATELRFGERDGEPVRLALPDGRAIPLRGAIDRVDRLTGGGLRVVDYKTGSARSFGTGDVYDGGRRLQHLLYVRAAERLLEAPVRRVEYHFPTQRGQNHKEVFARAQLEHGPRLVEMLLDLAATGTYLPTDDPDDCRFCDYAACCRVRVTPWGGVESPLARWSAEHADADAFDLLRRVREFEEAS